MRVLLTLIAALLANAVAFGGEAVYTVVRGSGRATFAAHATGHDFTGTTTDLRGHVRFDSNGIERRAIGNVRIQATALDTGVERRNRDMWEILKTEEHPDIVFDLEAAQSAQGAGAPAGSAAAGRLPARVTLSGQLEARGIRRPVKIEAELESGDDWIIVRGGFPVDVRDFDIEPPRAMLVIRMDPVIQIDFEVRFHPIP
jgi:polyisoprenoid-binding protein YceI